MDKNKDVKRETPRHPATKVRPRPKKTAKQPDVKFSNTSKIMYPEKGYTKADVLNYYQQVSRLLLPHLKDRPVTLERLPDGVKDDAPRFWQKNAPDYYPDWIPRVDFPTLRGKPVKYVLVNDQRTLLYLVNQGALTFHTWLSRAQSPAKPDYVLFDLDPGEATFKDVVKIAQQVRAELESEKVKAFVKTSGKSGLHALTPWKQKGGYNEARA